MVGGRVIETIDTGERIWISCRSSERVERSIYVERTVEARSVSVGDTVVWSGRNAFWTPRGAPFKDLVLRQVGPVGGRPPM